MNSVIPISDVPTLWREFLIDAMFAENYELGYIDSPHPRHKNHVVERVLPSLLHVKAVAILDYAIQSVCADRGLTVPKKQPYGETLKGRITFMADRGHLSDPVSLHAIRDKRNNLAHEPEYAVDWTHLAQDVRIINGALRELGIAGDFPDWSISSERSAAGDPRIPDAVCTFDYQIAIADGDKSVAKIEWSVHLMKDGA